MDDWEWYMNNTLEEYQGQWVAIKNCQVVVACKNPNTLEKQLKEKGLKIEDVLLASVPRRDAALVL